jgi:hypothetical protein
MFFFFFFAAFAFAKLFLLQQSGAGGGLLDFYAPKISIWVLSLCLPGILIFRLLPLKALEIILWNVLVVCTTMFLAQGGGIVFFTLARRPALGSFRILLGILLVFVILSPGINMLALALLILPGIAENWLPLRVQKTMNNEQ